METLISQKFTEIILLGGTTRFPLLSRLKADVLNHPVILAEIREPAATGAALMAAVGAGDFANPLEASQCLKYQRVTITPDRDRAEWYDRLYETSYRPLYSALADVHHALNEFTKQFTGVNQTER